MGSPTHNLGAGLAYDLMMAVGRAADGMAANSRKRMLAHQRAGDADAAALAMGKHLGVLSFMCRRAQGQWDNRGCEACGGIGSRR